MEACRTPDNLTLPAWLAPVIVDDLVWYGGDCHDGRYAIPQSLLDQTEHLVSLGLGYGWDFEVDLHARYPELAIDVYDPTVGEARFRRDYWTALASALCFQSNWYQVKAGRVRLQSYRRLFSSPHVRHHQQWIVPTVLIGPAPSPVVTLFGIFQRPTQRTFLKMDIDGGARTGDEWLVLEDALAFQERIVGVAIEVHNLDTQWGDFERTMHKLLEHYTVVHVHANNEASDLKVLELTLGRKGLIHGTERRKVLPLAWDKPNNPTKPDLSLVFA